MSIPLPTWASCQESNKDFATNRGMVVVNINARVQESYQRMAQWNIVQNARANFYLYLYGMPESGRRFKYRMNLIQGVNVANSAIQVGMEPKIKLLPRETGEKPVCYINTQAAMPVVAGMTDGTGQQTQTGQLLASLRPETYNPQAPGFPAPLNDQETALVEQMQMQSNQMRMQAQATGQPAPLDILPPNFYIEVNDTEVAKAMQSLLDICCEDADIVQSIVENCLYNGIFGYQFMLIEFDAEARAFTFSNPYFSTVHIDPFKTTIKQAQWAVALEFLDEDEACALFPDIEAAIKAKATLGPPTVPGTTNLTEAPLPWFTALLGRRMVIVETAWIRNQPFPMTQEEALKAGKVQYGAADSVANGSAGPALPGGNPGGANPGGSSGQPVPADGGEGAGQSADSGAESPGGESSVDIAAPAPTPQQLYLTGADGTADIEGGVVDPAHPKWPTIRKLREIRVIAGEWVYDGRSKRVDIPLGQNVNIPICFTPFGQGEPERLEPLQRAYNATLSAIVEHGDAVRVAPKICARELTVDNPELLRIGFNDPTKIYPVDGRLLLNGIDKVIGHIQPPDMPPDTWRREQILFDKFNHESDQSALTRGELPTQSSMSGTAIGQLQNAAKTSIDFKGMRIRSMLKHVTKVMMGDLTTLLTPADCAEMVRRYPVQVWYEIFRRHQNMSYDVQVELGSAADEDRTALINAAATALGQQAISLQSFDEALGLDPEEQQANIAAWQQRMQMGQPQQPMGGVQSQSGGGPPAAPPTPPPASSAPPGPPSP